MILHTETGIQCLLTICCRTTPNSAHLRTRSPTCSFAVAGTRQEVNRTVELVAAMKKALLIVLSISLLTLACKSIKDPPITGIGWRTVSLFDGKTFNGWVGDTNKSFHIQDG